LPNYEPWQCETVKKSHDKALDLKGEPGHETIIQDAVLRSETTGGHFWMTLTAGGHRDQTTGKDVKWGSWSLEMGLLEFRLPTEPKMGLLEFRLPTDKKNKKDSFYNSLTKNDHFAPKEVFTTPLSFLKTPNV
jgi:hypothetical protein